MMYHSNAFTSCYTTYPFHTYPSFVVHSCSNTQCEVTWSATSSSPWMKRKGSHSTGYSTSACKSWSSASYSPSHSSCHCRYVRPRLCRGASTRWQAWARQNCRVDVQSLWSYSRYVLFLLSNVRIVQQLNRQAGTASWPFSTYIFNFIIMHPQNSVWCAAQQPTAQWGRLR